MGQATPRRTTAGAAMRRGGEGGGGGQRWGRWGEGWAERPRVRMRHPQQKQTWHAAPAARTGNKSCSRVEVVHGREVGPDFDHRAPPHAHAQNSHAQVATRQRRRGRRSTLRALQWWWHACSSDSGCMAEWVKQQQAHSSWRWRRRRGSGGGGGGNFGSGRYTGAGMPHAQERRL